MRKKFSAITVLFLFLCLLMCFSACTETGKTGESDANKNNEQEKPEEEAAKFYPVVIYNGQETIENSYEQGTVLTVKAKEEDGKVFICWLMENKEYTDVKEFSFTVEQAAVVKAVYTSKEKVSLDLNGGKTDEEEKTKVLAYKEIPIETDNSLYLGYKFVLPVPKKERYTFVGWYVGEEKITDENGLSLSDYDGKTLFTARYEENAYVEIELKGGNEQIETRYIKHYLEDGNLEITSVPVFYRKATGWKIDTWAGEKHNDNKNFIHTDANGDGKCDICQNTESVISEIENNGDFILDVENLENKKKYVFRAYYKEAYKIVVRKGSGTGSYSREEVLNISSINNPGLSFIYWEAAGGKLGFYEGNLCILTEKDDNFKFYICDDNEESGIKFISVPVEEYNDEGKFVYAGNSEIKIPLNKFEKLLTEITGEGFEGKGSVEKETVISANFKPNEYTVVYELNCMVNGNLCVSADDILILKNAGFEEKEEGSGIYVKENKVEYNAKLVPEGIPEIENYTFGNWQRKGGGSIPAVMPAEEGLTFMGTFIPDKHYITVQIRDSEKAKGSVYMEGNVTSAYYAYGKEINFTVVANRGYEAWKWLDISSESVWEKEPNENKDRIELVKTEEDGDKIKYSFKYTVTGRETFTLTFDERDYKIIYKISVIYTMKGNVTENPDYFDGQEGMKKFSRIKEMVQTVKYNTENCNFIDMDFVDTSAENYVDTGLKWGNSHWEFSGWRADNQGLTSLKNFTMPSKNIIANATFAIKRHRVNFGGTAGVITDAYLINGIEASQYRIEDSESVEYRIPYGASLKIKVRYPTGYRYGNVKINGETIYDGNENGIKEAEFERIDGGTKYDYCVNFKFEKVNAGTVPIYFEADQNTYTFKYYVGYDFKNKDEEKNIEEYLELDKNQEITINGDKYYYLKNIKAIGGDISAEQKYIYNSDIKLHSINTEVIPYEYVFGNWKKYVNIAEDGGTVPGNDVGTKMPDDNCFAYGKLILNTYAFSIGTRTFDFETDPNEEKDTVIISEEISAGNQNDDDSALKYFSEKKLIAYDATGYKFNYWRLETTYEGGEKGVLNIKVNEKEKDVIIKETVSDYVFKYRLNSSDGSVSVFMTENLCASAVFEKIKFKVNIKDKYISVVSNNIIEQSDGNYIEYGENMRFAYSTNSIAAGKRISQIKITDMNKTEQDEGYLVESVNVPFSEDILNYTESVYYTSLENGIQSDININSVFEDIHYNITYIVYGPQNNIADLDKTEEYIITSDFEGNPYYATYSEDYKLMSEELLKRHLAEMNTGINLSAVMYSGWQRESIASTDADGKGFLNESGVYEAERIHHQKYYGKSGASARSVYFCYLVNIYSYTDIEGGVLVSINKTILRTNNYNKYFGSKTKEIVIPSTNGEYDVIGIGEEGFNGCSGVKTLILSDTVKSIGQSAFKNCAALENVIFGENSQLKTIGDYAFEGCFVLKSINTEADSEIITFPNATTTVGTESFKGCSSVRKIVISRNLVNIGLRAFSNCSLLSDVVFDSAFNEAIGKIYSGIFYQSGKDGNENTGVDLIVGANAKTVPVGLFSCLSENDNEKGGQYLRNVSFEEGENAEKVSIPGAAFLGSGIVNFEGSARVTAIGTKAFYNCKNLITVDLSVSNVTTVSDECFRQCDNLTEVILPSTLNIIGRAAFCEDISLISVYYLGEGIETIGDYAFAKGETQMDMERFVPYSLYEEVQSDPTAHKSIILKNISSLGTNAFFGCENATLLVLEGSNTDFGGYAFYGASGLTKIVYNVTESTCKGADKATFEKAGKLSGTVLEIGENVRMIPAYMFCNLEPVTEITIPSNLESVGNFAFLNVTKLNKINYNVSAMPTTYTRSPFVGSGTSSATGGIEAVIGSNVTSIPDGIFKDLSLLKSVDFGALTSESNLIIGTSAFESSGITSVEIPAIKKLTVNENAFKSTALVSFAANSQINTVEIYRNALYSINDVTALNAEIFGKTISSAGVGIWGSITEGYISVSRNESAGYSGTVYGNMTVLGDAEVDVNDTLTFDGESSLIFTANKSLTVKGDINVKETRITTADGYRLIGASFTADNFILKNSVTVYNELLICDNMTFTEKVTVTGRNKFAIMNEKTASFGSGLTIESVLNYGGNSEVKGGKLELNCDNIEFGGIDVYGGVEATVKKLKTIGEGLNVVSGFIRVENSVNKNIRYIVSSGSVAQINGTVDFSANNDEYVVEGNLNVSVSASLPYLINNGTITVSDEDADKASLTVICDNTAGYPSNNGNILTDVYRYATDNRSVTYIGSINKAMSENLEFTRYYLMRDIERITAIDVYYEKEVVFNEFAVTAKGGINIKGATIKFIKTNVKGYINIDEYSSLTAEGDATQNGTIDSEENDNAIINYGTLELNNVNLSGVNTVLAQYKSVTTINGGVIASNGGTALTAYSDVTVGNSRISGNNGINIKGLTHINSETENYSVTLNGVTVDADKIGINGEYTEKTVNLTVKGGNITGYDNAIKAQGKYSINLSDGATIESEDGSAFEKATIVISDIESARALLMAGEGVCVNNNSALTGKTAVFYDGTEQDIELITSTASDIYDEADKGIDLQKAAIEGKAVLKTVFYSQVQGNSNNAFVRSGNAMINKMNPTEEEKKFVYRSGTGTYGRYKIVANSADDILFTEEKVEETSIEINPSLYYCAYLSKYKETSDTVSNAGTKNLWVTSDYTLNGLEADKTVLHIGGTLGFVGEIAGTVKTIDYAQTCSFNISENASISGEYLFYKDGGAKNGDMVIGATLETSGTVKVYFMNGQAGIEETLNSENKAVYSETGNYDVLVTETGNLKVLAGGNAVINANTVLNKGAIENASLYVKSFIGKGTGNTTTDAAFYDADYIKLDGSSVSGNSISTEKVLINNSTFTLSGLKVGRKAVINNSTVVFDNMELTNTELDVLIENNSVFTLNGYNYASNKMINCEQEEGTSAIFNCDVRIKVVGTLYSATFNGNLYAQNMTVGDEYGTTAKVKIMKSIEIGGITVEKRGKLIIAESAGATYTLSYILLGEESYMEYPGSATLASTGIQVGLNAKAVLGTGNATPVGYAEEAGGDLIHAEADVMNGTDVVGKLYSLHWHSYITVKPTCTEQGYDYCSTAANIANTVTEDGYTVSYTEKSINLVDAKGHGNNGYTIVNETKHKCNDCGTEEEHNKDEVSKAMLSGYYIYVLTNGCSLCGYQSEYVLVNGTMTIEEAKAAIEAFNAPDLTSAGTLSVNPSDDTSALISDCVKTDTEGVKRTITVQGVNYYYYEVYLIEENGTATVCVNVLVSIPESA